jgi:hypothetical protein
LGWRRGSFWRFVVACGDGAELFEFAKEVLDEMARPIKFRVKVGGGPAVVSGRDDGRFTGCRQRLANALIGIKGLISDQPIGGHLWQQGIGAHQIVRLSRGQQKS